MGFCEDGGEARETSNMKKRMRNIVPMNFVEGI